MAVPRKLVWQSFLWLLAGAGVVALAWPFDGPVDSALVLDSAKDPSLHKFAWWCSKLGEGWAPAIVGIFAAAIYFFLNRPAVAAKLFFVVLTCELTGLAGLILRILTGRTRPTADAPQGFYGVWHDGHWIIGKYQFSAFPSGHSATAVGLAAAVWLIHRGWGAAAAVYALAVMWSRIALQCHHLTDVLASTFLAIPLAILLKHTLYPPVEAKVVGLAQRKG